MPEDRPGGKTESPDRRAARGKQGRSIRIEGIRRVSSRMGMPLGGAGHAPPASEARGSPQSPRPTGDDRDGVHGLAFGVEGHQDPRSRLLHHLNRLTGELPGTHQRIQILLRGPDSPDRGDRVCVQCHGLSSPAFSMAGHRSLPTRPPLTKGRMDGSYGVPKCKRRACERPRPPEGRGSDFGAFIPAIQGFSGTLHILTFPRSPVSSTQLLCTRNTLRTDHPPTPSLGPIRSFFRKGTPSSIQRGMGASFR